MNDVNSVSGRILRPKIVMMPSHTPAFISDVIRMAWADDVSFDQIKKDKGLCEADVIKMMRTNLKASSFKLWRKRVSGRHSKHEKRAALRAQPAFTPDVLFHEDV
jgi:uncharacterized protein (TIGR03643 family)